MPRMMRLAGIAVLYAVLAALLLVTPLSASEDPAPEPAAPPEVAQQPGAGAPPATEGAVPEEPPSEEAVAPPPAAPEAPPPQPAAPAEPAPPAAPSPEPAAIEPAAEEPARDVAEPRPSRRAPRATAAADTGVTISDFQFAPGSVTIDVGDTVTWTNEGPTPHSATADDGSFDTGIYEAGQSRSETFNEAGTFAYFCTPHPQMRGTITVRAASTGDGGGGDGTTGESGATGESGTSSSGSGTGETDAGSSGSELPATGLDTGSLALLGLVTLALGAFLRRRAAAAE